MTAHRVLVTGSRDWRRPNVIRDELVEAHIMFLATDEDATLVVVHGAASGADTIAATCARRAGWTPEPHPAAWDADCRPTCKPGHRRKRRSGRTFCPAAGNYRNQAMVDLGAELCLAFIRDHSRGATDCADAAERAGIPVLRVYDCACHRQEVPA